MHANDLPICEGRDLEMARVNKKGSERFLKVHALRDASTWSPNATFSFPQFPVNLEIPGTVAQRGLVLKNVSEPFFNGSCLARGVNLLAKCDEFPEFLLNY